MLIRMLVGGAAVSAFAALGDVLKPKSFAGLFGAAPSVAIASLALAVSRHGTGYAVIEARAMCCGALAFFIYANCVCWGVWRWRLQVMLTAAAFLPVWFLSAFGIYALWMRP